MAKSKKWDSDKILSMSAMLISLMTLFIFMYQTNVIRKQSRLSVTPRLDFSTEFNTKADSTIQITEMLENKGLGPAIIEESNIIFKGKKYPNDLELLLTLSFQKSKVSLT